MAAIAIELDNEMKNALDEILPKMGLDFNSFFSIYAAKVLRDRCIPFDIEAPEEDDPFYSKANMERLKKSISQLNEGKGTKHE